MRREVGDGPLAEQRGETDRQDRVEDRLSDQ